MNTKILTRNPELARNMYLELSKQRLVAMPVILCLLSFLVLSTSQITAYSAENQYDYLARYSSIAFMIITILWGAKNASDGVLDEYNSRTWDWQRMSTLSPWKMTIGKLFGSTIYNWYGGVICLIINLFATLGSIATENATTIEPGRPHHSLFLYVIQTFSTVLMAITVQTVAILASLMQMKKGDGRNKIKGTTIILLPIFFMMIGWGFYTSANLQYLLREKANWYGINLGAFRSLLSILFYTCWVVAGLYRTMRTELQYTHGLKWWVLFLTTSAIFNSGFIVGQNATWSLHTAIVIAAATMFIGYVITAFLLTIIEPKEIINYRTIFKSFRDRNTAKLYSILPLWTVTLLFVAVSGIITSITIITMPDSIFDAPTIGTLFTSNYFLAKLEGIKSTLTIAPFAIFGFLIRDIAIVLYVNIMRKNKRADTTAILYLLILYIVIPLIIRSSSIGFLFYPTDQSGTFLMLAAPLAEASIMIYLLSNKWKSINSTIAQTSA